MRPRTSALPSNARPRYDAEGRLSAIVELAGHTVSLGYDPVGQLSMVSSPSGEQLHFAYDSSDWLERVSDHAGRDWQYRYDGLGRLAEVINPDQTTRIYHYENPDHPYALTGITDERQVRFATYLYDRQGRAIASWHGEEAGRIDVTYANDLPSRTEHGTPTEYGDYGAFGHPGYLIRAAGTPDAQRTEYVYDLRIPGEADRRSHAKATTDCGEGDHSAVMR